MDECDVVVPRDQMADFLLFSDSLQNKYDIRIVSFGHAGDGNLHIYICKDNLTDEQFDDKLSKVFNDLYDRAAKIGGLVSGEHGIGYAKKSYLKKQFGPLTMSLMKNIKKVFDPQNILNPEKICE
jgi:glycolate oxidase